MSGSADLRHRPRRLGLAVARIGVRVELAGIVIQRWADELTWRRVRALRRWGQ